MTTNHALTAVPLADAAVSLQHDLAQIEELIAAAARKAEKPSADRCVLPLPAIDVEIELGGQTFQAVRESERTDDWHLLLPA
ncbi:MAG: hypothetical protein DK306_000821 [Chloroflexi bacterium]|nr:MAG: hypothetical protein DK306_000821 [Chloroflexota bacterium]